jgi:predicted metalloenzyme YecM
MFQITYTDGVEIVSRAPAIQSMAQPEEGFNMENTILTIAKTHDIAVDEIKTVAEEMLAALEKLSDASTSLWLSHKLNGDFSAKKDMFFSRHILKDFINGEAITQMELQNFENEFQDLDVFVEHHPKAALYPQEVWNDIEVAAKKLAALVGVEV